MADTTVTTTPQSLGLSETDLVSKETVTPSLPSPPSDPNQVRQFLEKLKEIIEVREGRRGNPFDQNITWRDLFDHGVIDAKINGNRVSSRPQTPFFVPTGASEDYTTPPAPTGFSASGAIENIILTWAKPTFVSYAYTEIWRSDTNNIGNAAKVGSTSANIYADTTGSNSSVKYYWVRHVNVNNVSGPYNSATGTSAQTSDDPATLMGILSSAYGATSQAPFFQIDTVTTINGVSIPAGTYIKAAFIADATITNAKIKDAAIDNAKIANLDAAKLTTGFLSADRIQSGSIDAKIANIEWAKITNVSVTSAQIANVIQSDNYDAVNFQGWQIKRDGTFNLNRGSLTAGVVQSTDGKFKIDLTNKTISIET
jgi:hypothetical protein